MRAKTVLAGHHHIQQRHINMVLRKQRACFRAVLCGQTDMPRQLQVPPEHIADGWLVVSKQNTGHMENLLR